ncbi:MbtH family NRPS accessory protein [Actinokineospora inagensis]|uniref:MbtH family NRPS accessory protein n=1 Tax=Actinokineospora inagensis TaxID=103730 RepID=UPI0004100C09|nr:MbtH family NRPS accessory protein [Actinokineospora inagensis]
MRLADYREYFHVIVNDMKCYSMWPIDLVPPPGWTLTGFVGPLDAALNQIAELWRTALARAERNDHEDRTRSGR